jgi:hypothetical protein
MMRAAYAVLAVLVAACGASVDVADDGDDGDDSPPLADAPPQVTPDATLVAPPDAMPAPCTNGQAQTTLAGRCYEKFTGPATWANAQAACMALGGTLVKIESAAENQALVALIGQADHFIGGTDSATEMQWLWYDGTPFVYTNWRSGEPNDANGNFPEDCAIIEGDQGGTWDDRPCLDLPGGQNGEYAYLCERPG